MSLKILIVDDNDGVRLVIGMQLKVHGFQVLEARSGAEALEVSRRELPDLVLMDVSMPELNGLEAARVLRADPLTGRIPVVALTAHDAVDLRERALAAGCRDFATKPIGFEDLRALIGRHVAGGD